MDQDRQIRFLIAPFFLYASLLWWVFIDPNLRCSLVTLTGGGLKELLPVVAAAGAATIPLGFSIGTLGLFLLKAVFWVRSKFWPPAQAYDASASDECLKIILREVGAPRETRASLLYAVATFDHELLPAGIHTWLVRRWNSFNVAFNSALAVVISFVFVGVREVYVWRRNSYCGWSEVQCRNAARGEGQLAWLIVNGLLLCLLLWAACTSWHETMGMIDFQSRRTNVWKLKDRKQGLKQG